MAGLQDFSTYDISDEYKARLVSLVTNLESENERLLDRHTDLGKKIDALKADVGANVRARRGLRATYDKNLATIAEVHSTLPVKETP